MSYRTQPILKERIWGGQKLKDYNKSLGTQCIGESWETDIEDNGCPVLIKFIDANDILSVQVHPDDEYARQREGQRYGKTEMWVILECDAGAEIIYGFNSNVEKQELLDALKHNSIARLLNIVNVKKGDVVQIPSGTVHTLGKGIVLYEIQQPSDLTYRLYDWDRVDSNGKKRELHIDKALEVLKYTSQSAEILNVYDYKGKTNLNEIYIGNELFNVSYNFLEPAQEYSLKNKCIISIVNGTTELIAGNKRTIMEKGDTWIVSEESALKTYIYSLSHIEFIKTSY